MERLTVPCIFGGLTSLSPRQELIDRLAAYEDTGLEPQDIAANNHMGCVFYANRRCNLNNDWCPEGPGCPHETDSETALLIFASVDRLQERVGGNRHQNNPLTLEELRSMDGEAVWLRDGRRFLIDCDTDTACEKHGLNTSLEVLADIGMYRYKPDPWPLKNERGVEVEY